MVKSPGELVLTEARILTKTIPAGAGPTTDVPEKTLATLSIPSDSGDVGEYPFIILFAPDAAVPGAAGNYHTLQLFAHDNTGAAIGVGPIAALDFPAGLAAFAAVSVPILANGKQRFGDMTTFTYKTVHTGAPSGAFPGGSSTITLTHLEDLA